MICSLVTTALVRQGRSRLRGTYPVKDYTPIELQHARKLLAGCALFRNLTPDERTALAARAHMRAFEAGDTIFLMGAQDDSMVAVLSGDVKISMTSSEGKEIVLHVRIYFRLRGPRFGLGRGAPPAWDGQKRIGVTPKSA